jgi:peptide-methionine (R)-S-oxide reductase
MRSTVVTLVVVGALVAAAIGWLWWNDAPPVETERFRGGKIVKTDAEWRKLLTDEQYRVTRKKGTEPPRTGAYWNCKTDGVYHCICCGQPLFDSTTKFESGTGWPSYWQPVAPENVALHQDRSWFATRTEVVCSRCDAHLGHVFEDAPNTPTGLRYCMNSAALKLVERGKESKSDDATEKK